MERRRPNPVRRSSQCTDSRDRRRRLSRRHRHRTAQALQDAVSARRRGRRVDRAHRPHPRRPILLLYVPADARHPPRRRRPPVTQVRFGQFTLDSATRELLLRGRPVHLSPKAFQLLRHPRGQPPPYPLQRRPPRPPLARFLRRRSQPGQPRRRDPRRLRRRPAPTALHPHRPPLRLRLPGSRLRGESDRRSRHGQFRLIWKGGRAILAEGEHILGRYAESSILLDSTTVSLRHARILIEESHATIEDLGSKNGTLLNDKPVDTPQPLTDGDRIRVGTVGLTFRDSFLRPPARRPRFPGTARSRRFPEQTLGRP